MNRSYPWLLVVLLALASCTGTPQRGPQPVLDPLRQSAQQLAAQGDHLAAAQLYLARLETAPPNQHAELRLQAAGYLAGGRLWEQLQTLLASTGTAAFTAEQHSRYQLLLAELALAEGRSDEALARLQGITDPDSLPDRGRQYYELRASAYSAAGNPLEAARQLIWLDGLLDDPQQRLDNQYHIWDQLSGLSDMALQQMLAGTSSTELQGWMELSLLTRRTRGDREQWLRMLSDWRVRYPDHGAEAALLPDLAGQTGQPGMRAGHIAVMLPLTGRTAEAAAAIRDGILAAYYADALQRPELRFYDTGSHPDQVWAVYQNAVLDGAGFVIGPLLKESIQQLASAEELPVPVLALNNIDSTARPVDNPAVSIETTIGAFDSMTQPVDSIAGQPVVLPLYQFGLSPEDEAGQVAARMYRDGHETAIALAPETAWGDRVVAAFEEHFAIFGGELLESARYAPGTADFKAPMQSLLNLDGSISRHRDLQRLLGQNLHYEPRRRQDVDAVFILGYPEQARQIYPQLKFHHAGGLPVYSTSHTFSTNIDQQLDRDVDGLMFCDMPWVLDTAGEWVAQRKRIAAIWPDRDSRYPRLFALGLDAYRVLPWLEALNRSGFVTFPGATGVLSMDTDRHLSRALDWAQFRKGLPEKLAGEPLNESMEGPYNEPAQDAWRPR